MLSASRARTSPSLAANAASRTSRLLMAWPVPALLWALGLAGQLSGASKLTLKGEIDASNLTGESPNLTPPEQVWGLAFSPDETQLAIGLGSHATSEPRIRTGHVVIVSAAQPEKVLHRFEIRGSAGFAIPGDLVWAPSGQRLAVYTVEGTKVFSLDGEQICGFHESVTLAGFLTGDRIVGYNRPDTTFVVHPPNCSVEDSWRTPDRFAFALATCPEAGLVAVGWSSKPQADSAGVEVVRYPGHDRIRQLAGSFGALGHNILFADSCRLVCAGQRQDKGFANHAICWEISTGEVAAEARSVTFGDIRDSFEAAGEEWVASTVYNVGCHEGRFWNFIDEAGCWERYKRLVVWSVRSGREVLSLDPPEQPIWMMRGDGKRITEPPAFTISASHAFLAEGGSGRVRVYGIH